MKRFIPFVPKHPAVSVIRLQGVISSSGRGGLNDAGLAGLIEKAFAKGRPRAVALVINSPGGSPVQSSLIAARIRRLSQEKKLPVHAFVEDVAASGGYWLASAADYIWADETSIVGSIGVISSGFGLEDFIERYGIKRRVYTAGNSKSMLDPFQPENPEDVARLKQLQEQIHQAFIHQITTRRAGKMPEGRDLFTGEIWAGQGAQEVGLIDGIAHLVPKMKDLFGDKVRFNVFSQKRPFLARFGMSLGDAALATLEDRAAFARFGL
ncbi:S49 family peptidase [Oceaniglobus ichthyenteri]|uniref:S49 family peptidase n=1 Tax=Oceaniglobus ichthyenteri TaxID=2136177 RepID=UPI000D3C380A|nr:S49 family peptidase [Oceaniglobus ichthyenteri]